MKIYGIFRGFPGLGRVMSGISILSALKNEGHEVKAYSYMQGIAPIDDNDFEKIIEDVAEGNEITSMGLNPIGRIGERLIETICNDNPDLVIIDGEPLLISTLAAVYPRSKIMALLNPADLYNPSLLKSSKEFFHAHYLAAGTAVVHGIDHEKFVFPDNRRGCNIYTINTILRQEVIDVIIGEKKRIVAILGGGCNNSSLSFFNSTLEMGYRIIEAAGLMSGEQFTIYCNDKMLAQDLLLRCKVDNVSIVEAYTSPKEMYKNAKAVVCRAGRNTISEVLYLNIPAVLMSTSGDYRSEEQENNIDQVCNLKPGRLVKSNNRDSDKELMEKISSVITASDNGFIFQVGNKEVLDHIKGV